MEPQFPKTQCTPTQCNSSPLSLLGPGEVLISGLSCCTCACLLFLLLIMHEKPGQWQLPHSFFPIHQKRQLGREEWAEAEERSSFSTKATLHALIANLLLSVPFNNYFFNIDLMPGTEGTEMSKCRACALEAQGLEWEEGIRIASKPTIT